MAFEGEAEGSEGGGFGLVNPEEIRSEKFTFNIVVLMHLNRLMTNFYNSIESNSADSLLALQTQIMGLDDLIGSIVRDKNYTENSKQHRQTLADNYGKIYGSRDDKFAYFEYLEDYFRWIMSEFKYVPKMFPSRPVAMVAGKGFADDYFGSEE